MSACREWIGRTNAKGYGLDGRKLAHRAAWERMNGPIASGLCVLHRCDNPPCVNLEHLFLGTQAENVADMHAKGRARNLSGNDHPRRKHPEKWPSGDRHWTRQQPGALAGERNGRAKLTKDDVESARRLHGHGETFRGLARRFGVDRRTITQAVRGETWS